MKAVKNVVLVVADTFRRDKLGAYGDTTVDTPQLDRLAAQGTVFDYHYAAGFPTMPTRADHALGKWTFTFMGWEPLPRDQTTLSQIMAGAAGQTDALPESSTPPWKSA